MTNKTVTLTQYELGQIDARAGKPLPEGASDFYELGWWNAQ